MQNYLDLLSETRKNGIISTDRTGVGTSSLFAKSLQFDLKDSFPLLTTKQMFVDGVIHEVLWLISGDSNCSYLKENNVHIWDAWADSSDDVGSTYGTIWRNWHGRYNANIDQLAQAIEILRVSPESRRIVVSAWNPAEFDSMALPPCPVLFQFYSRFSELSCAVYQRSADMFLGLPFDIAGFALLTILVAKVCRLMPNKLTMFLGDAHIYKNHFKVVDKQLSRKPMALPRVEITRDNFDIDSFKFEDIKVIGYNSHSILKAKLNV